MESQLYSFQHELLIDNLTKIFGEFDATMLALIEPRLDWIEIGGGDTLFRQDDTADALYFVVSGRLQALITDVDGKPKKIGEIMRGETVGEMAIFTGEARSATIVAIRDSVLVRLSKEVFEQIIVAYPGVAMNVTKLIINRLQHTQNPRKQIKKPVNICLVALHDSVDMARFVEELRPLLVRQGAVYVASGKTVDTDHDRTSLSQTNANNSQTYSELTRWLNEQESQHEFMLYVADPTMTEWTKRCLRQADEIMFLADTAQPPGLTLLEEQFHSGRQPTGATEALILLHSPDTTAPRHTAAWLSPRPNIKTHYHLRRGMARDMARLARILSGTAVGLVLAGGGAKGFAHIGVLKALQEADIPVDFVGGTSVGALVAAAISFDHPADVVIQHVRKGALYNPTRDYNWLPFVSIIRGRRMAQMIQDTIFAFLGRTDPDLEDSWLPMFALSSNYSQAREVVHTRGPMVKYLQASSAIPGVFPPVVSNNDLLVDGGTFNNFPADVMSRMGVGKVIGVDLVIDKPRKLTYTIMPTSNDLLRDRFRAKKRRKYRVPSVVSIMINSMLLYSSARRNETKRYIDLYFNPDVSRYGLMAWHSFDQIVAEGYKHGRETLARLSPEQIADLRG